MQANNHQTAQILLARRRESQCFFWTGQGWFVQGTTPISRNYLTEFKLVSFTTRGSPWRPGFPPFPNVFV
jgi:hypothetical protein